MQRNKCIRNIFFAHSRESTTPFYTELPFYFLSKTQKRKKLHRRNKVIKTKKKQKKQTNSEFTHLHGNTYKY